MIPNLDFQHDRVSLEVDGHKKTVLLNEQGNLNAGSQCKSLHIQRPIGEKLGDLSVLDDHQSSFRRFFWVNNVPKYGLRGQHAHKECVETIVSISGKVDLLLIDRTGHMDFLTLGSSAIVLPPRVWIVLRFHSVTSCVLVGCSHYYEPDDYIFDFSEL